MNKEPIVRRYGLMIGIVAALVTLLALLFPEAKFIPVINLFAIPTGIILACWEYGREKEGNADFGMLFQIGFFTGLIVTIILLGADILFNVIFPDLKEAQFKAIGQEMRNNPQVTEQKVESYMQTIRKYWLTIVIAMSILRSLVFTIIGSLIGAIITPKNRQY